MADWTTDYNFVMANEDRAQAHAIVPDLPPGAFAISGINSVSFPDDFKAIAGIPQADRGPAVEAFYEAHEGWAWLQQLTSDGAAERILDAEVNSGMGVGVKIAQEACNALGASLVVDGGWGPLTLAAINACDPAAFVTAFRAAHVAFLQKHCANNPYYAQLLARAQA